MVVVGDEDCDLRLDGIVSESRPGATAAILVFLLFVPLNAKQHPSAL